MDNLTHLSLFTGIGGIDLAAEWAGFTTVGQVEFGNIQTQILQKHWPNVPRWKDIHDFTADEFFRRTKRRDVTLISGGFPCQPFSVCGKRMGASDDRALWPEYRRVISEIRHKWVIAENVPGLLTIDDGRYFGSILRDLASMGYLSAWGTLEAAGVGAPHHRKRVFIVANADSKRRHSVDENQQKERDAFFAKVLDRSKTWTWTGAKENDLLLAGYRAIYSHGGHNNRNDDGIPCGVDRLKCLGNAVVPQQIYPILEAIATIERKTYEGRI